MTDLAKLSDADLMTALKATPDVGTMVTQEAQRQGVDPALALSVARAESNLNPAARSPKGAVGPMQLMPATAAGLGVDPTDTAQNIQGGVDYLKQQLARFQDPELAVAAYNAGPGAVQKAGGVPNYPETQAYVGKVMGGAQLSKMSDADLMAALGVKAPAVQPQAPPAPRASPPTGPAGDNPLKQYATGVVEGAKPLADTLARFLGIPSYLTSSGFANSILSATGRPKMPVAAAPQTTAQSMARTAGQMTVGAVAPGSLAQRVAAVAAPTLGSEAGGQLAKGTPMEGAARVAGAALGGAIGGAAAGGIDSAIANARNPRITPAQLRQQASSLYTELRNRDVQFTPSAVESLHSGMSDIIGPMRDVYPTESNWVDTVANTLGQNPTADTLATLRSKVQQALTTPNGSRTPDQLRIGSQLVDEIDNFMNAAGRHPDTMTTGTGDPARVGQLLGQARDMWRRMRNVETVENLAESANIRNGTAHMGGNAQNFTSQKLRTFIDPSTNKSLAGLSADEQQQLRDVVMGTPATRAMKIAGNLSPTKGLGMLANLTLGAATGGHAPLVLAPLGYGANLAGAAMQRAQLDRFLRTLATPGAMPPLRAPISPALQGAAMGAAIQAPMATQRTTK